LGEYNGQMALLTLVVGDVDVKRIDRPACVTCRDILRKIPPGYTKIPTLKGLSAEELVKIESPGLAIKTVNIHMQLLSAVFRWAVKFGYIIHLLYGHTPSVLLLVNIRSNGKSS